MEDQGDFGTVLDQSLLIPRSDSKLMRKKRSSDARKRVNMFRSDEINTHHSISLKDEETSAQFQFGEEEMSQVTKVPVTLDFDAAEAEKSGTIVVDSAPRSLDLNNEVCNANNLAENSEKQSLLGKQDRVGDNNCVASRGIGLDLNVEYVSSSVNEDHLKLRDVSECGSSTDPLEKKDPLRVWKEMKQNGFLSSSYGGITMQSGILPSSHGETPVTKESGKKKKQDVIKKRLELAKREPVDRFTKNAAPSGLLNELNPGIINHLRNKKQVHSIIESLVSSERLRG